MVIMMVIVVVRAVSPVIRGSMTRRVNIEHQLYRQGTGRGADGQPAQNEGQSPQKEGKGAGRFGVPDGGEAVRQRAQNGRLRRQAVRGQAGAHIWRPCFHGLHKDAKRLKPL